MERINAESKEGFYVMYKNVDGTQIIVLEGLSSEDSIHPSRLQSFLHAQYTFFEAFYWIMLLITLLYVTGVYIVIPLLNRIRYA